MTIQERNQIDIELDEARAKAVDARRFHAEARRRELIRQTLSPRANPHSCPFCPKFPVHVRKLEEALAAEEFEVVLDLTTR